MGGDSVSFAIFADAKVAGNDLNNFWGQDAWAEAADPGSSGKLVALDRLCSSSRRTYMWVLSSLKPKFADLAVQLLLRAVATAAPDDGVQAQQWLRALPELLLRMTVTTPTPRRRHENRPVVARKAGSR